MARYTFARHPAPVGEVLLGFVDDRLAALEVVHGDAGTALEGLCRAFDAAFEPDDDAASEVIRQLDEYFRGERHAFELDLDWGRVRGFTRAALEAVCEIPYGETAGYAEVAVLAGRPRAARAVGTACATTPFSIVVPVHRVIRSDGTMGEYGGHPEVKRFLLDLEKGQSGEVAHPRERLARRHGSSPGHDDVLRHRSG